MTRVAVVDVGSNSVRLLIAQPPAPDIAGRDGAALDTVERHMRITRLGKDVDAAGRLDDEALRRTLDCVADYAERWRAAGAQRVRITATSAVRDAVDRERFFEGIRARAGVEPEVLSGEEEARTTFAGATASLAGTPPWCVLDIGGGSTELIRGQDEPEAMTSRQLGCVRLTERCLPSDPPTPEQIAAARATVLNELEAIDARVQPGLAATLVGVAGTVTTLGALHLGLDTYVPEAIHGARLPIGSVRSLTRRLLDMPARERAALGPMAPGREDVIAGGALILLAVMERFGFDEVLASEADILDGLALQLLAEG